MYIIDDDTMAIDKFSYDNKGFGVYIHVATKVVVNSASLLDLYKYAEFRIILKSKLRLFSGLSPSFGLASKLLISSDLSPSRVKTEPGLKSKLRRSLGLK